MNTLFLDTETTDLENPRIIQLAYKHQGATDIFVEYYKPPTPIDFMAMATHHITEKKVADKTPFAETETYKKLPKLLENSVLVAHNAKFDIGVLKNEGIETPVHICTYKVAHHIYDYPNHKMQYLRYRWGIDIDDAVAHDAQGDVLVLEKVFEHMLEDYMNTHQVSQQEAIKHFIDISRKPSLLKKLSFGKYRDKTFEEVKTQDRGYLQWALENMKDITEDLKYTITHHLSVK